MLLLCSVLRTVSWYCRSGHLPGTLISIVFHAPSEALLDSLSLSHLFFFFPSYVHSMHCSSSALASLVCFHFFFYSYQPSAGYFWQKRICSIFVCNMYKQLVKHLIFSYALTWSHDNLTRQFVKCWADFFSWICPSRLVVQSKISGSYTPEQKKQTFLQQLYFVASPLSIHGGA